MHSRWQVFFLGKSECLTKSIEMIFSQKPKIFSQIFCWFMRSTSKFGHCLKKDEPHRWFIFEAIDYKKRGYLNA